MKEQLARIFRRLLGRGAAGVNPDLPCGHAGTVDAAFGNGGAAPSEGPGAGGAETAARGKVAPLPGEQSSSGDASAMQPEKERLADDLLAGFATIEESEFPEQPPAQERIGLVYMKQHRFLPLSEEGEKVLVAMADPADFQTQQAIRSVYGKPLDVRKASIDLVNRFLYEWYEAEADMAAGEGDEMEMSLEEQLWDNPEQLKDMASEEKVIRMVRHLITRAISYEASDIHIEPRKTSVKVRYRIDGVLHDQDTIAGQLKAAITSRVKLMAKMDIAEMRLPQDGRFNFKRDKEDRDGLDVRVSSIPVHHGESLVMRLLRKESVQLSLSNIGFPEYLVERFRSAISLPYGMLLVTGPTGSGKTTTLYGALNTINTPDKKIVTVEDPVEYQLEGVNQVQVQGSIGLTFASALRSFLRHDPDVMLIGEIRDTETAEIAVQSALTGHMVFSTLHTNDAAGAIARLTDMGVERFMVSSCLVGVLAQRLVRRVCASCRKEVFLEREKRELLARDLEVPAGEISHSFMRGEGCDECGGTGYCGRMAIFEFLPMDEAIQREIVRGADRNAIFRAAEKGGMVSLRRDGLDRVRQGLTTYEEVMRVTR